MQIAEIDLKKYSNQFASYTELRLHENRIQSIALLDGNVIGNSRSANGGVSARVFDKGAWGFCAKPEVDNEAIESTIVAATRNAEFLAKRTRNPDATLPWASGQADSDFTTRQPRQDQTEIVAFLRRPDAVDTPVAGAAET